MSTTTFEATGPVLAGGDRHEKPGLMIWGRIPLATKVSTAETGGLFYSFEHREMAKGGPPRHVHHEQDEWFYVLKGRYVFEVGDELLVRGIGDLDARFEERSLQQPLFRHQRARFPHFRSCADDRRDFLPEHAAQLIAQVVDDRR